MTTATDPHEEFEIAALRRARGSLGSDEAARLAAHVATCPACHSFAATAEATEVALRRRADAAVGDRDWGKVRAAVGALERDRRNRAIRGVVVLVVLPPLIWWGLGWIAGAVMAVLCVVMGVITDRRVWRPNRPARRLASIDTQLLVWYRRELDREIEQLRKQRQWAPVLLILFGVNALLAMWNVVANRAADGSFAVSRPAVITVVVMLLSIALTVVPEWRRSRIVLPQLERERRDLGK